jgi:hypothetical protein
MGDLETKADQTAEAPPRLWPLVAPSYASYAWHGPVTFGWDAVGFEISKSGAFRAKSLARFTLTEKGWAECWEALRTDYPDLAKAVVKSASEKQARADRLASSVRPVIFPAATYLGGLLDNIPIMKGTLELDVHGIGVRSSGQRRGVRWEDCGGITVDGGEVAKSKVGAVLAFGVLGGLAAKGSKSQTVVTARHKNGSAAYFLIDDRMPPQVRAAIHPLLHKVSVLFLDEVQVPDAALETRSADVHSVASQLRELAALRDEGLLTDEEFTQQKARLLS